MKRCKRCGLKKPSTEFNKTQVNCRQCQADLWQVYRNTPKKLALLLWASAKRKARRNGIVFDLKPSEIDLPERCPVLDIPILPGRAQSMNSPSVERVTTDAGYVNGNVVVMSLLAAYLRMRATPDQLRAVADWMDDVDRDRDDA